MVLEIRLALLLLLGCSFTVACTATSQPVVTDQATAMGSELKILSIDDKCVLQVDDDGKKTDLELQPKPPCYFSRREEASPQSFSYPDANIQAAMIVVGSPLQQSDRERWGVSESDYCGQAAQGVLIRNNKLELSQQPMLDGVICKDKGADEKDFWYFAH